VLLVLDSEPLRLQRLLVKLAEDVLLGEVLRADDDRRASTGLRGRCRSGSAEDDRDSHRDREGGLRGAPVVLADHDWSPFRIAGYLTGPYRRATPVTTSGSNVRSVVRS